MHPFAKNRHYCVPRLIQNQSHAPYCRLPWNPQSQMSRVAHHPHTPLGLDPVVCVPLVMLVTFWHTLVCAFGPVLMLLAASFSDIWWSTKSRFRDFWYAPFGAFWLMVLASSWSSFSESIMSRLRRTLQAGRVRKLLQYSTTFGFALPFSAVARNYPIYWENRRPRRWILWTKVLGLHSSSLLQI